MDSRVEMALSRLARVVILNPTCLKAIEVKKGRHYKYRRCGKCQMCRLNKGITELHEKFKAEFECEA